MISFLLVFLVTAIGVFGCAFSIIGVWKLLDKILVGDKKGMIIGHLVFGSSVVGFPVLTALGLMQFAQIFN